MDKEWYDVTSEESEQWIIDRAVEIQSYPIHKELTDLAIEIAVAELQGTKR